MPKKSQPVRQLAVNLHAALTVAKKTQADIIRSMPEVSPATINHWFTGRRQPQLDNLRKLAQLLDTSMSALVADEPDYAHTKEERMHLALMREQTPEMREAVLALMQAQLKTK